MIALLSSEKALPNVSWEGIPLGSSRKPRNQAFFASRAIVGHKRGKTLTNGGLGGARVKNALRDAARRSAGLGNALSLSGTNHGFRRSAACGCRPWWIGARAARGRWNAMRLPAKCRFDEPVIGLWVSPCSTCVVIWGPDAVETGIIMAWLCVQISLADRYRSDQARDTTWPDCRS